MNAEGWERSAGVEAMLKRHRGLPPFDERKLRLFAAACCRRAWDLMPDPQCREAIEVMERYVDGLESAGRMREVAGGVIAWASPLDWYVGDQERDSSTACSVVTAVGFAVSGLGGGDYYPVSSLDFARSAADLAWTARCCSESRRAAPRDRPHPDPLTTRLGWKAWRLVAKAEPRAQADLLREILGNPFRPAPFDPRWRTPDVLDLGRSIVESADFAALPILGDALEEAGCGSAEILDHLRRLNGHVRGCWALDLTLGRGGPFGLDFVPPSPDVRPSRIWISFRRLVGLS